MIAGDIRYAWRALTKAPAFTSIAAGCLALGIGNNTTIFSVVDGALLQPYPYPDAERIVTVDARNPRLHVNRSPISYRDFQALRDESTTLGPMAAFGRRGLSISDGTANAERYTGAAVSWNLFDILGTPPVAGRSFSRDDDRPGAEPVVMLGFDVWQTRYGGDPSIVGRSVAINGQPHTVIGVMPARFAFPETQRLWIPLAPEAQHVPAGERWLQVFARLRPGTPAFLKYSSQLS